MQWIDRDKLKTDLLAGTFLNLGSATSVEIAAGVGFDWLLIDLEHGSGSFSDLRSLLIACRNSEAAPIVRIPSVDPDLVKFVMDSGAAGIMFPFVSTAEEAKTAVDCMKYPPMGRRGVASAIRATDFSRNWENYFQNANENSLVVAQIETTDAVENVDEIAAVDGVDVLFVGPLDLSVNLGHPADFAAAPVEAALQRVVDVCRDSGKVPGILSRPEFVQRHKEMGFRFFALGSDIGAVVSGLTNNLRLITS